MQASDAFRVLVGEVLRTVRRDEGQCCPRDTEPCSVTKRPDPKSPSVCRSYTRRASQEDGVCGNQTLADCLKPTLTNIPGQNRHAYFTFRALTSHVT